MVVHSCSGELNQLDSNSFNTVYYFAKSDPHCTNLWFLIPINYHDNIDVKVYIG